MSSKPLPTHPAILLDCGHAPTPTPGGIGTGRAIDRRTGRTRCYPCAEAHEREMIKTAQAFTGYLTDLRPNVVTTWTGATLAVVTSYSTGARRIAPSGGTFRMQNVRARTPDGTMWHGQGSSDSDAITLRRFKNQRKAPTS